MGIKSAKDGCSGARGTCSVLVDGVSRLHSSDPKT